MKSSRFLLGIVACLALFAGLSAAETADDERALREAGLPIDGPSLLALVRQHTLTAEKRTKIAGLIAGLGDVAFAQRENASKQLFAMGRLALPVLREASKHKDAEIARRAKRLIARLERSPARPLPVAVPRLLAARKPAGSVEALLAYLPHAEEETRIEETRQALTLLARRDGGVDPALLRAMSADALTRRGAALALAWAKERKAIPVLIDLLVVLPAEQIGPIEETLYRLAGDSAPETPMGTDPAEREKCRDAWAAWWKRNAARVDFTRLDVQPSLGFTLICDNVKKRIYEIGREGKERWSIDKLTNPLDAVVLPGNRVLIADYAENRVTERDFKGNILWQKQIANPWRARRLPNGNTFIVTYTGTILEVDRAGKEVYKLQNIPGNVVSALRLRQGTIAYLTQKGECVLIDTSGKRLGSFETHHVSPDTNRDSMDRSSNGRILITRTERQKVVEYTTEGKKPLELDAPQAIRAVGLANGNILVSSYHGNRVYELNRAGKIVWEYKASSPTIRARRR